MSVRIACHPLTKDRWNDFERLFGANGACGGCWCMLWRLPRRVFDAQKGEGNREAMHAIVRSGEQPGLLAYRGKDVIGWCALGPRSVYPALERSRVLKPVDDRPVWSVSCLFVHRAHRKQGVSIALLHAAVDFARARGASILEAYPVEPKGEADIPAAFAWTGIPSAYLSVGFEEIARRSPTRPILRISLGSGLP